MKSTDSQRKRLGAITLLFLLGVLASGSPTRAFAQTVKPADLIGAWAHQGKTKIFFTFLADSTVTFPVPVKYGQESIEGAAKGRWHLAGDTLIISQVKSKARGQNVPGNFSMDPRLVTLKDGLLTLKRLALTLPNGRPDTSAAAAAAAVRVYQRVAQDTQPAQPATKP